MKQWLTRLSWPVFVVFLIFAPGQQADGQQAAGQQAAGQAAPGAAREKPDASAVLKRMAETLAQTQRFSVTIRAGYDVLQDTGQKITFTEQRSITLSRPDHLRIESQQSDGRHRLMTFDGGAITVSDTDAKVYGRIDKPGTTDDAVRHVVQDLNMRLPLALLLVSTLPAELERRLKSIDYVERSVLPPMPTDHLAGRTADVDFEIWVAAEGDPLPQRVAITYKAEKGAPQYRAEFVDWNLNPDVSPARLAFTPPDDAQRIPFLVRTPRQTAEGAPARGKTPPRPGVSEGSAR